MHDAYVTRNIILHFGDPYFHVIFNMLNLTRRWWRL